MNSFKHGLTRTEKEVIEERSTPVVISQQPPPPWGESVSPRGSTVASCLEILFMNKRLIIACSLIGILFGYVAILVWPRSYQSVAKLMIKVGRESVSLDPTATTGPALMMLQKTQEEEIISALEVLNSRQVAEKVVDAVGADAILNGELPKSDAEKDDNAVGGITIIERLESLKTTAADWLTDALLRAGVKDDISSRELAVMEIQSTVSIHSPQKSSVVIIDGRAQTPELAQAIVDEFTESYMNENLEASHTDGSFEFFDEQSIDTEKQLDALVAARAKFMQDNQVVSIEDNRRLLSDQISGIDRDLVIASGDLEQAEAEVEDLESKLLATEDEIVAERTANSDLTWSGMRQQVYELQLEEQNLAANFTAEHPRLLRVRSQLEGAMEILAGLKSDRIDDKKTPNPIKMGLQEELQKKQTLVVGLRSIIKQKQEQRHEMEKQAKELLDHERKLTELDRDIELTTANLTRLQEKREEARVIDELHTDKFSNIHVFQPASFVERAVSPEKKILGAGFLFLGLMTGLVLSFLREGSCPTLRTSDDVEFRLGAPVAASIARIKNMKAPRIRDQKAYRKICRALMAEILMSQHRPGQTRGRSLGIIGVDVGAGASTLAVNLAIASNSDCHLRTTLVDADSRRRTVSKMFGLDGAPGLFELVSGTASHDECLQKINQSEIDLIASSAESSAEMLSNSAPEIVQALQAYLHDCDLLIVDLPAASQPDQAVALAQHLDSILVVVESETTQAVAADRLLQRLSQSDTELIGVVLTKTRSYLPKFIRRFVAPQSLAGKAIA